ncbi:DUF421 domain-containing protein [Clostridium botulinum]|uniref:YetF C-terminal domain-containing protein n=1 Tax=Clostridium botulinum (strain Langeland / NCTC 10281 / Type F) TaxID=441772 RepID=A7GC75_CLOBL|nr:DUF421 domain-containing protein [Clostridium botulinum]ABS40814.1 conserved hypothetical protein [Clostridium botulinum F str. Langeland]KKM39874.1 membrane protein [Clostridium botulinum]MBY6792114.1 DUF421 domain-containing protein [Clostridium botulinum]MBY6936123.1 DUF421 domain-containing protein [Clostridium botulinum]MBY6943545.1 DUF421 domain-containing protein [Clostridium botulinum]
MLGKIMEVILRSIFTYIILLVLGRIMGRKLISNITFYDFMIGVLIGSIGVRIALGPRDTPLLALISAIVVTILVIITDYLDIKSINFRKLIDGDPIVLISNGKLLDYNLKKVKITINTLMMELRKKDIFNIDDVAFAVIETDGELSVLPKANKKPITTGDLNISTNTNGLMRDIIIDGKIMYDNLKSTNHDEQWVRQQLKNHNIYNVEEVFYAGLNSSGILCVSTKTKQ